jgi:site-specific recombinase XerD
MANHTITLPRRKKSKYKKNRVFPMNSIAWAAVLEMLERSKPINKKNGTNWVFAEYHDGPEYLSVPAHWFPEIVKAAQVEDFTWHSLRHDFASQLVMKGVDLKTVQELMGHSSLKQTAIYAHLSPKHKENAAECLVESQ